MTSTHTDQIEEIKTAEEKAKHQIEKEKHDLSAQELELKNDLDKRVKESSHNFHEKQIAKLETIKKEADQSKKQQLADSQSKNNSIVNGAKAKEDEAVSFAVSAFMNHIKS
ncbi:hypothetical protein KJ951_00600 [Patescibacteria group bacterium]|nr:hypothetical protein [Patescibacteria group bacterium]MBU1702881.1 hypothetical protein [Patescibacteria group bacterium]MBU1953362.1 hypothetical protein [Patescibacteria group bacterium]